MNEEPMPPPSADEARAALAAIEAIGTETRRNIAGSCAGPVLIWWGLIWVVMLGCAQFRSDFLRLSWVFMLIGFAGQTVLQKLRPPLVKQAPNWRAVAFWLGIFVYAGLFLVLLEPWDLLNNLSPADSAMVDRKITAYFSIVPMFAYVIIGPWVSRFFVGLGLLMTALILVGYYFLPGWFYLWVGVIGGGTLILSGLFIRKFWK
jgi:hypothetical protein